MGKRNYQHELQVEKRNHPERVKERAARNAARAKMEQAHGKAALQGKQVDHKNGRPSDNNLGNLRIATVKQNDNGRAGGPAKMGRK